MNRNIKDVLWILLGVAALFIGIALFFIAVAGIYMAVFKWTNHWIISAIKSAALWVIFIVYCLVIAVVTD